MEYGLVVFRARSETIAFANTLKSNGINVLIVSTPREISVSCGISVRFSPGYINLVKKIISNKRFNSFSGVYLIKQSGPNLKIMPL